MASADDQDRAHRKAGCLTALGLWLLIGLPLLFFTGMSDCPRNAPTTAACDSRKQLEVLFWLLIFPLLASLCGWAVYRLGRKRR